MRRPSRAGWTVRCESRHEEVNIGRLQFGLMLSAAGLCLALLGSSLTTEREPAWDPREGRSSLFMPEADQPVTKRVHRDSWSMGSNWRRPATFATRMPLAAVGEAGGVRLNLVSLKSAVSTNGDVCPYIVPLNVSVMGE